MLNELNLLGIKKKVILARFDRGQIAVMEAIDGTTEKNIDKLKNWFNGKETINRDKVFLYGEVNLFNNEDIKTIKRICPISDDIVHNQIYSGFNYELGTVTPVDGNYRFYFEVDPVKWFKFNHCLIGKPTRVIVYKTTLGML